MKTTIFFPGNRKVSKGYFPRDRRRQCSSAFSGEEDSRAPTRDVFKICAHSCALLKSLQYQMLSQNTNLQPPPGLANLPMNLKTCLAKGMKMMLQLQSPLELLTPVLFLGKLIRKCFLPRVLYFFFNKNAAVFLVDNWGPW